MWVLAYQKQQEIAGKLNFNYVAVSSLQKYLDQRLADGLTLGLIHQSAETLPLELVHST